MIRTHLLECFKMNFNEKPNNEYISDDPNTIYDRKEIIQRCFVDRIIVIEDVVDACIIHTCR